MTKLNYLQSKREHTLNTSTCTHVLIMLEFVHVIIRAVSVCGDTTCIFILSSPQTVSVEVVNLRASASVPYQTMPTSQLPPTFIHYSSVLEEQRCVCVCLRARACSHARASVCMCIHAVVISIYMYLL